MSARRGFTLVELLVAIILFAIVGGAIYNLLIRTQRLSRQQAEQGMLQDNVRTGTQILPAELREVGFDANAGVDLIEIGTNRIRFRAMRGMGIVCAFNSSTEIRIRQDLAFWYRSPAVQDGALLFVEKDPNLSSDDEWLPVSMTAVDASTCAGAGSTPALRLTLDAGGGIPAGYLAQVVDGAPVRFFEIMEIGLYTADGRSWLGAKSISKGEEYQPVLGPLAADNGVEFTYFTATNGVVPVGGNLNTIRTIQVTVRGLTEQRVNVAGGNNTPGFGPFELTTRVALRNTLRP